MRVLDDRAFDNAASLERATRGYAIGKWNRFVGSNIHFNQTTSVLSLAIGQ